MPVDTYILADSIVVLVGLFLGGLGVGAWFAPDRVRRFLLGMAQTPARHGVELVVRLLSGAAFLVVGLQAPGLRGFQVFGAVLLLTTAVMVLIPWQRHRDFARRSVPRALRALPLLGAVSLAGGVAILAAMVSRSSP